MFVLAAGMTHGAAVCAQESEAAAGRDFPKTLILDEPGVDDEISIPTLSTMRGEDGRESDASIEIDKRLTETLQVQINAGYRALTGQSGEDRTGWDDVTLTSKLVVLNHRQTETILTVGVTHVFGGSGSVQAGADAVGATAPIFYFGQGLGATAFPDAIRAFAVTGTLSYVVPDRARGAGERFAQGLQSDMSLQYSLEYLSPALRRGGLPRLLEHVLAIAEVTYDVPTTEGSGEGGRQGVVAPGLIYAGDGYQIAVEALVPLTRASGKGVGAIAQLNLSFSKLGLGALAGVFH